MRNRQRQQSLLLQIIRELYWAAKALSFNMHNCFPLSEECCAILGIVKFCREKLLLSLEHR